MKIQVSSLDKVQVIRIEGKMALGEGLEQLRSVSHELLEAGHRRIVLDMSGVPWLDSASIGEVVATYKRVRDHEGQLRLVMRGRVHDMFTMYELQKVLDVHETVDAALSSFVS
jgi:anti-sigma B factor antagonist